MLTSQMSALATEHAVTSTLATGGVCWPMPRLRVTMRPSDRVDPRRPHERHHDGDDEDDRRGRVQEEAETRKKTLRSARMSHLFSVSPMIPAATCCGAAVR